jgi:hypothetical protein
VCGEGGGVQETGDVGDDRTSGSWCMGAVYGTEVEEVG